MTAVPRQFDPFPEDWTTALGVVAHPDDMEYGASAAVARWTGSGKTVSYL
ncbi:MAG: PIG-L family deacetylase, partial [Actinomycetota bacterium]|nr:PIG-L family deacetylase [Actinomycetota bacterium]